MADINSPCSQIDAVKASAGPLRAQVYQSSAAKDTNEYRKASNDLQTLNSTIQSGDPKKAQTALQTAKTDVDKLQQVSHKQEEINGTSFRNFEAQA